MELNVITRKDPEITDGKWFDYQDGRLKIASTRSNAYQTFATKRFNAARRGRAVVPEADSRRILVDGICRLLVKDWEGFTASGEPVECTEENVRRFVDPVDEKGKSIESAEAIALREFIWNKATELDEFMPDGASDETESATAADLLKRGDPLAS